MFYNTFVKMGNCLWCDDDNHTLHRIHGMVWAVVSPSLVRMCVRAKGHTSDRHIIFWRKHPVVGFFSERAGGAVIDGLNEGIIQKVNVSQLLRRRTVYMGCEWAIHLITSLLHVPGVHGQRISLLSLLLSLPWLAIININAYLSVSPCVVWVF